MSNVITMPPTRTAVLMTAQEAIEPILADADDDAVAVAIRAVAAAFEAVNHAGLLPWREDS